MKTNYFVDLLNKFFWTLGIGYDFSKEIYIRDRKGRFSKEAEVIRWIPIKDNR